MEVIAASEIQKWRVGVVTLATANCTKRKASHLGGRRGRWRRVCVAVSATAGAGSLSVWVMVVGFSSVVVNMVFSSVDMVFSLLMVDVVFSGGTHMSAA